MENSQHLEKLLGTDLDLVLGQPPVELRVPLEENLFLVATFRLEEVVRESDSTCQCPEGILGTFPEVSENHQDVVPMGC